MKTKLLFLIACFLIGLSGIAQQLLYQKSTVNATYNTGSPYYVTTNYSNRQTYDVLSPTWYNGQLYIKDISSTSFLGWNSSSGVTQYAASYGGTYSGRLADYYEKAGIVYYYYYAAGTNTQLTFETVTSANFIKKYGTATYIPSNYVTPSLITTDFYLSGNSVAIDKTSGKESFILWGRTAADPTMVNASKTISNYNIYRKIDGNQRGPVFTVSGLNLQGTSAIGIIPNSNNYITANTVLGFTPNDFSGGITTVTYPALIPNNNDDYKSGNSINLKNTIFISSTVGYGFVFNANSTNVQSCFYIIKTVDAGNTWNTIYQSIDTNANSPFKHSRYFFLYAEFKQDRNIPYLLYLGNYNSVISIDTRSDNISHIYDVTSTLAGIAGFDASNGNVAISEVSTTDAKYDGSSSIPNQLKQWSTPDWYNKVYLFTTSISSDFNIINTGITNLNNYTWCGSGQLSITGGDANNIYTWYSSNSTISGSTLSSLPNGITVITLVATNLNSTTTKIVTVTSIADIQNPTISAPTTVCSGMSINITTTGNTLYANGVLITSPYIINVNTNLVATSSNGCKITTSSGISVTAILPPSSINVITNIKTLTGLSSTLSVTPRAGETYIWSDGTATTQINITPTLSGLQTVNLSINGICGLKIQTVNWTTYSPYISPIPDITILGTTTSLAIPISANVNYQIVENENWLSIIGNTINVTTTTVDRIAIITISSTVGSPQVNQVFKIQQLKFEIVTIPGIITLPGTVTGTITGENISPTITGIFSPLPLLQGNLAMVITINGNGFGTATSVSISGILLTSTLVGNSLLVTIPANVIVSNTAVVVVKNPGISSQVSVPISNVNVISSVVYSLVESRKVVSIYPNPTSGHVVIDANGVTISKIEIYNATGSKIREEYKSGNIDLSSLPPGIYLFRIFSGQTLVMAAQVVKN